MQDVRCTKCRKLLAKAVFKTLEIKCPRCKFFNKLSAQSASLNATSVEQYGDVLNGTTIQPRLPGRDGGNG